MVRSHEIQYSSRFCDPVLFPIWSLEGTNWKNQKFVPFLFLQKSHGYLELLMNHINHIYIDNKAYAELTDDIDKRIVLESARMLQDYSEQMEQFPEGKINLSKFGSVEITGFPKELTKIIRNTLLEMI